MNRVEVLDRMKALQDEKGAIIRAVMERFNLDMRGKSSDERQKAMLYGSSYTAEDRRQLNEINEKIEGLQHILREGFFPLKRLPKDTPEWVKAVLY